MQLENMFERFHVYAVNDSGEKRNIALAMNEEQAIHLVQSYQCAWPDWDVTYDTKAKPLEEFARRFAREALAL